LSDSQVSIDDIKAELKEKKDENTALQNKIKFMELENKEVELKFKEWEASFNEQQKASSDKLVNLKRLYDKAV